MKTTVTMEFGPDDDVEGWFCSIRDNEKLTIVISEWLEAVRGKIKYGDDNLTSEQEKTWETARDLMWDLLNSYNVKIDY